jgi:hypothetical protein
VPIVPGLVRLIVVPWKSSTVELVGARLADDVLVGRPEVAKSIVSAALIDGTSERAGAVGLLQVDREAEVDVRGRDEGGLPSFSSKPLFISGIRPSALTTA